MSKKKKNDVLRCAKCKKKISGLPFRCSRCDMLFCAEHRVPESHGCKDLPSIKKWKEEHKNFDEEPTIKTSWRLPKPRFRLTRTHKIGIVLIIIVGVLAYLYFYTDYLDIFIQSVPLIARTSITELNTNPENYEGKTLKVGGELVMTLGGGYYLMDEQGYKLDVEGCIEKDRYYDLGSQYEVNGVFTFWERCVCQDRALYNITEDEWSEFQSKYPSISEDNITGFAIRYLLLPSPDEGWSDYLGFDMFYRKSKSECLVEPDVLWRDYNITFRFNATHTLTLITEVLKEYRCRPNSTEKVYYFDCTEPLRKVG